MFTFDTNVTRTDAVAVFIVVHFGIVVLCQAVWITLDVVFIDRCQFFGRLVDALNAVQELAQLFVLGVLFQIEHPPEAAVTDEFVC